jgi:hypothetical protein
MRSFRLFNAIKLKNGFAISKVSADNTPSS